MIVLLILSVRKCYWLLEQPSTSKLLVHPELKHVTKAITAVCTDVFFQRLPETQRKYMIT